MRPSVRPDVISLSVLWGFFVAELGAFLATPDLTTTLAIHAVLVLVVLLVGATSGLPMLQMAALVGLGSGPFGAGICAVLATILRLADLDPQKHRSWYRLLSGEPFARPPRSLFQDLQAGRLGSEHPISQQLLISVFRHGNRTQKQAALRWLARQDISGFPEEIRHALDDDDNTIRIEAAALVSRSKHPAPLPDNC